MLVPSPSPLLHHIFTSTSNINNSFIKLECFLGPFLRPRSHDGSAHTFRSSLRFLEGPKRFFLMIFWHFLTTFFDMFGLIGSVKKKFKSPGSWHECRPIYGLHFVYLVFFYPLYKKGFFGGPNKFHHEFLAFFGHFDHQMADFLKL